MSFWTAFLGEAGGAGNLGPSPSREGQLASGSALGLGLLPPWAFPLGTLVVSSSAFLFSATENLSHPVSRS